MMLNTHFVMNVMITYFAVKKGGMKLISIFNILNKTQSELLEYCKNVLTDEKYSLTCTDKYLFGIGEIPVMLVAHLDTVHKRKPEIYFDRSKQVLWSPDGIGGDDRCGVYAILKIIETYKKKPYVLFTTDEETGGLGATAFCNDFSSVDLKSFVDFIIEIDRRGCGQAVFYDCGNKEFQDYILKFGFKEELGSFSDISFISPTFDIASVNLSAGYYNEHTANEHIFLDHLNQTIQKVLEILEDEKNHKFYDYQEIVYVPKTYYPKTYYSKTYGVPYYVEQDFMDLTDEEWELFYGCEKPKSYKELKKKFKGGVK